MRVKGYDNYVIILNVISVKEYAKTIQFIPKQSLRSLKYIEDFEP